MYFILGLIVGLVVGGGAVWILMRKSKPRLDNASQSNGARADGLPRAESPQSDPGFVNPAVGIKKENIAKLEEFVAGKSVTDKITNDDVQTLLDVSDATAERYLQELESRGLIKQFGEVGKEVYYLKV